MADSVFTKIIKGEIPSNKIYEDNLTYAFLDHNPKTVGHTLVISKRQVDYVWDLPPEEYAVLMEAVRMIAQRIREVLQPKWVGEQIEGAAVAHAHVHVFPFNSIEEYDGHLANPPAPEELAEMARKLAF
jgi:histidine triad (HIT) family protein